MENIEIGKLFKKIIMNNSLKSIRSVFVSGPAFKYDPPYQREYIWHEVKATNFIETILWHGDAPPIVLFKKPDGTFEVIDGRQRCETIDLFLKNAFDLKLHGLDRLWYLSGKTFSQLEDELKNRIFQTKLRCIIIEPKDENGLMRNEEESLKREIFKRYNMGMSALKKEEVFKAQYLHDEITVYLKKQLREDKELYIQIKNVFDYKSKNEETIMQHIRQLLVLKDIPINRYIAEPGDIISKYYDYYAYHLIDKEGSLEQLLNSFKQKLQFLAEIKEILSLEHPLIIGNLVVYDCIYWAIDICEKEGINFEDINNKIFKSRLINHIIKNVQSYVNSRSNFAQHINQRYNLIATFFSSQLVLSFANYLKADRSYSTVFRNQINLYMEERFGVKVKGYQFTQATPTSATIGSILDEMKSNNFIIRPPYQRQEIMNIPKASALIESILLRFKLPPVYVFIRKNGIREVIDGQQRLLAIIAFLGEKYLNEYGDLVTSQKNNFALNLTNPLLPDINYRKFKQLAEELKKIITDYEQEIIEINETDNINFKPEELYKRLNHKPFPIKEHTFEFWNAYVDSDLILSIKDIYHRNKWLYVRKNDIRMHNKEMITCLCYVDLLLGTGPIGMDRVREVLDFYEYNTHIVIRIKNKAHISAILEQSDYKAPFLLSLNHFEKDFIDKMICLTDNPKGKTTDQFRNKILDTIFQTGTVRMFMRFLVLWLILRGIPIDHLKNKRSVVLNRISKVFATLKVSGGSVKFEKILTEIWEEY